MAHTMTIEIPAGVSVTELGLLSAVISSTVQRRIGHPVDVTFDPDPRGNGATPDLSRAQELAVDAMAAIHGRSAVQHQADGSVVIIGLLDDIERDRVCIERDGRERWRR